MDQLQKDHATLIRTGPRTACWGFTKLSVANFTAASVRAPAAPLTGFLPTGEIASSRDGTLTDLDVVPQKTVPPSTNTGDASATGKAVAENTGDVSPSRPSASHTVNTSSPARSDDGRPLVFEEIPANANGATICYIGKCAF